MRVSNIVVPHFGQGGRGTALDDACVIDCDIGLFRIGPRVQFAVQGSADALFYPFAF
jgi:hypothetical protein